MAWPTSSKKKITYLLVAPILFPLWLTLPDTRTTRGTFLFFLLMDFKVFEFLSSFKCYLVRISFKRN
ncbi:hypothetical protein TSAR_005743 [Trichomalopsis sarcophagae]|uniref:Uncharacterized protein n=1 Tax=Trichomalopsis sarcophagae TaxID=543379 RepID=A0A232FEW9_9HYME|nr:hypothetical protein TSAR_005743 [Trichomalopsis sarcophagae]